jgi:hypothetical protein
MTIEQAHIVSLDPLPDWVTERARLKLVLKSVKRFLNPQTIEVDSLAL